MLESKNTLCYDEHKVFYCVRTEKNVEWNSGLKLAMWVEADKAKVVIDNNSSEKTGGTILLMNGELIEGVLSESYEFCVKNN